MQKMLTSAKALNLINIKCPDQYLLKKKYPDLTK